MSDRIPASQIPEASELWSLVRNILTQGHSQQQDYAAGKYANYEELSARVDAAARERSAEILSLLRRIDAEARHRWEAEYDSVREGFHND